MFTRPLRDFPTTLPLTFLEINSTFFILPSLLKSPPPLSYNFAILGYIWNKKYPHSSEQNKATYQEALPN